MKPNPHDALVRHTFGDLVHAHGLLRSLLPAEVAECIEWGSLSLQDGSFIDPQLAERQTDLLYRARLVQRGEVLLYLLLEHQSSSDRWMPLRMWVYLGRIWEQYRRSAPQAKSLPAIVPMVLHHSQRGWTAPTRLEELLQVDEALHGVLGSLLPSLHFQLTDLTREDDEVLRAWLTTDLGKLVALCLKHAPYDAELERRLPQWLELFGKVVRAQGGVAGLDVIGRYLLEVNEITVERLRGVLESALEPQVLEAIMTGAEKLREQGRDEGRAQGRHDGRAELLLKQLTLRFGHVPGEVRARIASADIEQLDLWGTRLLSADSLAEVVGE